MSELDITRGISEMKPILISQLWISDFQGVQFAISDF